MGLGGMNLTPFDASRCHNNLSLLIDSPILTPTPDASLKTQRRTLPAPPGSPQCNPQTKVPSGQSAILDQERTSSSYSSDHTQGASS
ncbi:hypothetical protein I350_05684 [Cryptococcus amylolentus CBS 6273]|uniref:Uncharacterized protein n=1 Tax=Cryptococcus amylolentus CBS 6273 TaxID=1296118 RepID=A0A1E3JPW1_9TREE|nr:hypothetical protein I350_05684 [Cryptococcus amylolentus CBS 6273]